MLCKTLRGAKELKKADKETKRRSESACGDLEGCHVEGRAEKELRIPSWVGKERDSGPSRPTASLD